MSFSPCVSVLVTGGAGFVGSNLIRHMLAHSEYSVINVDKLTYAGNLESLTGIDGDQRYTFVHADITDRSVIEKIFAACQPDAVMHLAAESHVDRSIDGPAEFIQTNVVGTYTLLDAAQGYYEGLPRHRKEQFRFLHISTDEVFGSLGTDDPAFDETTPYNPHSPYSATKAASDHLVRTWRTTYGLPTLVTNCSNNYGPYQFPEKLVPVVILNAPSGRPIPVYGRGENVRDWLYVEDHAAALVKVLSKGRIGHTYNIGGNNERRNIDLVRMICSILDGLLPVSQNRSIEDQQISSYQQQISFVEDRPGHDLRYAMNTEKLRCELGWKPKEDLESGFRKTVRWYLDNREWWERILSGEYRLERQGLAG